MPHTLAKWETVSGQFGGYLSGRQVTAVAAQGLVSSPWGGS